MCSRDGKREETGEGGKAKPLPGALVFIKGVMDQALTMGFSFTPHCIPGRNTVRLTITWLPLVYWNISFRVGGLFVLLITVPPTLARHIGLPAEMQDVQLHVNSGETINTFFLHKCSVFLVLNVAIPCIDV